MNFQIHQFGYLTIFRLARFKFGMILINRAGASTKRVQVSASSFANTLLRLSIRSGALALAQVTNCKNCLAFSFNYETRTLVLSG